MVFVKRASMARQRPLGMERYHFALRRLHSLTGIVPIGAFLFEHMLTNFGVVVGGADQYIHDVGLLQSIPWLRVVEWTFIFLPLAFHAIYGLFITFTGQINIGRYAYGGNIRYLLQRVTALLTLIFVVVHLGRFRFNYLLPGGHEFETLAAYTTTTAKLVSPWIVAFYFVGIVSAVYHFSNGIWTALITWGVTLGPKSQVRAGWLCAVVGVAMGVMGLLSLFWFHGQLHPLW